MKSWILTLFSLLLTGLFGYAQGWDTLGVGFAAGPSGAAKTRAVAEFGGDIYVGGFFTALADGTPMNYLSRWNGSNWVSLGAGMNEMVRRIHPFGGKLYIGGQFTLADALPANYIVSYDGAQFDTLAGGLSGDVKSMTDFDGKLIVGGDFIQADGMTVNYVASWDGASWDVLGSGLDDKVLALGVWGGELYAGGKNALLSGSKIAKWNGVTWSPVTTTPDNISNIHDFIEYQGELVACGNWNFIGGVASPCVAKFNGSTWSALGSGLSAETTDLEVYNGQLYASGHFTASGGTLYKVGRWDGTGWRDLQNGLATGVGAGMAFWPHNEKLYFVGDNFTQIGFPAVPAKLVAVWDICPFYPAGITATPTSLNLATDSTVNFYAPTDNTGGDTHWIWDFGDGASDSLPEPVHTYAAPDTYTVSLIVSNGFCRDTATIDYVVDLITSNHDPAAVNHTVVLFPNPTQSEVTLQIPAELMEGQSAFSVTIFDLAGRECLKLEEIETKRPEFSLSSLPNGTYFYWISTPEKVVWKGNLTVKK